MSLRRLIASLAATGAIVAAGIAGAPSALAANGMVGGQHRGQLQQHRAGHGGHTLLHDQRCGDPRGHRR